MAGAVTCYIITDCEDFTLKFRYWGLHEKHVVATWNCREPSQHLLKDPGKPRKNWDEMAGHRTFRVLTLSQSSGILLGSLHFSTYCCRMFVFFFLLKGEYVHGVEFISRNWRSLTWPTNLASFVESRVSWRCSRRPHHWILCRFSCNRSQPSGLLYVLPSLTPGNSALCSRGVLPCLV